MGTVLRLERLRRTFGGLEAVKDVTLEIGSGERLAIIGPNGAGKTTLFNLITGELKPTAGRIWLEGQDITKLPVHRRTALGIGRTYQIIQCFRGLSVLENALLAVAALEPGRQAFLRRLRTYSTFYDRARRLLESTGLGPFASLPAGTLAYGDQRKLDVALALAGHPRVLLLDEPTAGLSAPESHELLGMLARLPTSITILLIEHDMTVAFAFAQRMVVLHLGEAVASGSPEEVRQDPRVQEIYLGGEVTRAGG